MEAVLRANPSQTRLAHKHFWKSSGKVYQVACGVTFSFYEEFNILRAILIIGLTTFAISAGGVYVGNIFGNKFKAKAQLLGGIILILLA